MYTIGMIKEILILILWTIAPFLELRASIPYGILILNMEWWVVFLVCVLANILLAPLVWVFVHHILWIFLKIKFIDRIYNKLVERSQRKIKPYVDKYGKIGLALFIGVPLPGSGVYSGCLGAYLLGFKFRDYMVSSMLGVLIAGSIVLLLCSF